jgi:hypothetical protein
MVDLKYALVVLEEAVTDLLQLNGVTLARLVNLAEADVFLECFL